MSYNAINVSIMCIKRERNNVFSSWRHARRFVRLFPCPATGDNRKYIMSSFGRSLILAGGLLLAAGLLITFGPRLPFRPGRLPGDFVWRGKSTVIYFPLGTCLLLSLLFSLLSLLFRRR